VQVPLQTILQKFNGVAEQNIRGMLKRFRSPPRPRRPSPPPRRRAGRRPPPRGALTRAGRGGVGAGCCSSRGT